MSKTTIKYRKLGCCRLMTDALYYLQMLLRTKSLKSYPVVTLQMYILPYQTFCFSLN